MKLHKSSSAAPGERLCERDGEAIGIDADGKAEALIHLVSRCQEKLCASRCQFPMRGFEIFNREADRARPCQRLCGCPILSTYARSYLMEREGGGAGLKLAPPRLRCGVLSSWMKAEPSAAAGGGA